jgi:CDP-glucose 4,6-dehydratase
VITEVSDLWRDRRVAVTGAMGFLGSHLTQLLVDAGAEVVALVRDDVPPTPVVKGWRGRVSEVWGDVADQALLERMLGEYECETVFHLAAQTQVVVANRNAASTFDSNVRGTWSLLEACRRSPSVQQIVVASSDKAYGDQPVLPYTEEMPLLPTNPYDVSKACADLITLSYAETFDVPVSVARCGNFFGPGDMNWNRLVPGTIRSVVRGRRPVIRSDGTPTRDYLHVVDGAFAYIRLAECMADERKLAGQAFNFSPEEPLNVVDLVDRIYEAFGGRPRLKPDIQGTATGEIQDQYLSSDKARRVLGWIPRMSLGEALRETVEWYRGFLGAEEDV